MDGTRFDQLTKAVAASSRRSLLKAMAGALVGGALAGVGIGEAGAAWRRPLGYICRKDGDCASNFCGPRDNTGRRRCQCLTAADCPQPPAGDQCHIATCVAGACGIDVTAGQACDDGNPCTSGDACTETGDCAGAPLTGVACDGGLCCDGTCQAGYECCQSSECVAPQGGSATCTNGQCVESCDQGETLLGDLCCPDALVCGQTCLSAACDANQCLECSASTGTCESTCTQTQECCGGQGCKTAVGEACLDNSDCCSGVCVDGTCVAAARTAGETCDEDADCAGSLLCCPNYGSTCQECCDTGNCATFGLTDHVCDNGVCVPNAV